VGMSGVGPNGKPVESVWDYPRPPRLQRVPWRIRVVQSDTVVDDAPDAVRVLETSQPPAYYIATDYVRSELLRLADHHTCCEWKGVANYADIVTSESTVPAAAWTYARPSSGHKEIAGHWAFYAQRIDQCWVDDELVISNPGSFYGGWITANVVGPFKGGPGTDHW
jgi:uncharacterized protein (DUF427 family)